MSKVKSAKVMSDSSDCESSDEGTQQTQSVQNIQQTKSVQNIQHTQSVQNIQHTQPTQDIQHTQPTQEGLLARPIVSRRRRGYYKDWDGLTEAGKRSRLYKERVLSMSGQIESGSRVLSVPIDVGLIPVFAKDNNHEDLTVDFVGSEGLTEDSSSDDERTSSGPSCSSDSDESLDVIDISCGATAYQCFGYDDLDKSLIVPNENPVVTEYLKKNLNLIATKFSIQRDAVNSLLALLNIFFPQLPRDSRKLKDTERFSDESRRARRIYSRRN